MTTQLFMRNYIDLINEMEQPQPQQLDEGVIDSLVGKVKQLKDRFMAMPGATEALKKAQQHRGEIEQMLKSGKSSQEIMAGIKQLAKETAVTEALSGLNKVRTGVGIFATLWALAVPLINLYHNSYSWMFKMDPSGEKTAYLIANVGLPLWLLLAAMFIFKITYEDNKQEKQAKDQNQAYLDQQQLAKQKEREAQGKAAMDRMNANPEKFFKE